MRKEPEWWYSCSQLEGALWSIVRTEAVGAIPDQLGVFLFGVEQRKVHVGMEPFEFPGPAGEYTAHRPIDPGEIDTAMTIGNIIARVRQVEHDVGFKKERGTCSGEIGYRRPDLDLLECRGRDDAEVIGEPVVCLVTLLG